MQVLPTHIKYVGVLAVMFCAIAVHAGTQYVQPSASISAAVALANSGDTIVLTKGVYNEHSITITKPLVLKGVQGTVIDARNQGRNILYVHSDSVRISGITFKNVHVEYTNDNAAIKLDSVHYCVVERCSVVNGFFGIYLARSGSCVIQNNTCIASNSGESQSGNGIHLWTCRNITVSNNTVIGHRDGIYFEFIKQSYVFQNHSERNIRYGLHFMFSDSCTYKYNLFRDNGAGVAVMYTRNVIMEYNTFEHNWGPTAYGLLFKDISDSYVSNCTFIKNTAGIHAEECNRITVVNNTFQQNGWAIRLRASSQDSYFAKNNFIGNTFDVAINSSRSTCYFEKNYWSAYQGYDLNKDGVGDIPFAPVRLSSAIVEKNGTSLMLLHSLFLNMLDAAEHVLPSLTPETLIDTKPAMKPYTRTQQ